MRPLISYDDIVPPEQAPLTEQGPQSQMNPATAPPPAKKRKTIQHQQRRAASNGGRAYQSVQHWDDPGSQEAQMSYDEAPQASTSGAAANGAHSGEDGEYYEEEEEEESRELTYEEIWDDSALIEAWNSAAAEYEAFHGPGKKWKEEPVKKSPLWYNVPPETTSKPKASTSAPNGASAQNVRRTSAVGLQEEDSTPLNFDTFVPTHDPSLAAAFAAPAMSSSSALEVGAEAANVSQDEAFSRAMTAMYWSGYWTAVYHCRRNEMQQNNNNAGTQADVEEQEDEDEEGEPGDEELLPAQR
ncbi:hypothetical protein BD414DRAFT_523135 [Trametes punicea]|nr:hypothetical protein BD414DRAFT_523135 [Trametes punicea]